MLSSERGKEYSEQIQTLNPNTSHSWSSRFVLDTGQIRTFFNQFTPVSNVYSFSLAAGASGTLWSKGRKLWTMPFQLDFKISNVPTLPNQKMTFAFSNADTSVTYLTFDIDATSCETFLTPPVENEVFSIVVDRTKYMYRRHSTGQDFVSAQTGQTNKAYEFGLTAVNAVGAPTWQPTFELVYNIPNITI